MTDAHTAADRWLTDASRRATADLDSVLDVEAGLQEVLSTVDDRLATPATQSEEPRP